MCMRRAAVGCPDIGDVENAVVERRFDLAIIRCNVTAETYFLTCVNTRWTGEMSPCTAGMSINQSINQSTKSRLRRRK